MEIKYEEINLENQKDILEKKDVLMAFLDECIKRKEYVIDSSITFLYEKKSYKTSDFIMVARDSSNLNEWLIYPLQESNKENTTTTKQYLLDTCIHYSVNNQKVDFEKLEISKKKRLKILNKNQSPYIEPECLKNAGKIKVVAHYTTKLHELLITDELVKLDLFSYYTNSKMNDLTVKIEWTRAILNAYITQVRDKGVNHNDLKLENMFDGRENETAPKEVIISNFKSATTQENKVSSSIKTLDFTSPESLLGDIVFEKSDIFSIGRNLLLLYGHTEAHFPEFLSDMGVNAELLKKIDYSDCCGEIQDLTIREEIRTILISMLESEPEKRHTAEYYLQQFNEILLNIEKDIPSSLVQMNLFEEAPFKKSRKAESISFNVNFG